MRVRARFGVGHLIGAGSPSPDGLDAGRLLRTVELSRSGPTSTSIVFDMGSSRSPHACSRISSRETTPPGHAHEPLENRELARGELRGARRPATATRRPGSRRRSPADQLGRSAAGVAAQERPRARRQDLELERLAEVVVGALREALDLVLGLVHRRRASGSSPGTRAPARAGRRRGRRRRAAGGRGRGGRTRAGRAARRRLHLPASSQARPARVSVRTTIDRSRASSSRTRDRTPDLIGRRPSSPATRRDRTSSPGTPPSAPACSGCPGSTSGVRCCIRP